MIEPSGLQALLSSSGVYGAEGPVARFQPKRVSLPSDIRGSPRVRDILPADARVYLDFFKERVLLSPEAYAARLDEEGPAPVYMDSTLRRHRRSYTGFVRRLVEIGMVTLSRSGCRSQAGLFSSTNVEVSCA